MQLHHKSKNNQGDSRMNRTIILLFTIPFFSLQILNAQWIQTNGPYAGLIKCFAASGSNIFAGTDRGGIYLSTNNGINWASVNTDLTNKQVYSLLVSWAKLFAGTWDGVFESTNSGANWVAANSGLTNNIVYTLTEEGTYLFAGTQTGIYRSTNDAFLGHMLIPDYLAEGQLPL